MLSAFCTGIVSLGGIYAKTKNELRIQNKARSIAWQAILGERLEPLPQVCLLFVFKRMQIAAPCQYSMQGIILLEAIW